MNVLTSPSYIPNWTHEKSCRTSDPINIIFEHIDLKDIETYLAQIGWTLGKGIRSLALDQVIPDPANATQKQLNDAQLLKAIKWKVIRRYHMRLWKYKDMILASVHIDIVSGRGHIATDFESVKRDVAHQCASNPKWEVVEDLVDLDNRIAGYREPYNNGKATVVRLK